MINICSATCVTTRQTNRLEIFNTNSSVRSTVAAGFPPAVDFLPVLVLLGLLNKEMSPLGDPPNKCPATTK